MYTKMFDVSLAIPDVHQIIWRANKKSEVYFRKCKFTSNILSTSGNIKLTSNILVYIRNCQGHVKHFCVHQEAQSSRQTFLFTWRAKFKSDQKKNKNNNKPYDQLYRLLPCRSQKARCLPSFGYGLVSPSRALSTRPSLTHTHVYKNYRVDYDCWSMITYYLSHDLIIMTNDRAYIDTQMI